MNEHTFPTARLALSIPIVNAHIETISTAPIFASHPFDLQHFPPTKEDEVAHVGAPGANVEVKIVAIEHDSEVDVTINDPTGTVCYTCLCWSCDLCKTPDSDSFVSVVSAAIFFF